MGLLAFIIRQRARPETQIESFSFGHASLAGRVTFATNLPAFGNRAPKRPEGLQNPERVFALNINLINSGSGVNYGPKGWRAPGACSSPLRDLAERLAISLGAPVIRAGVALARMGGQSQKSVNPA